MIYLRTGANGSCKTLFTLQDVRKLQLETSRPVCINARFRMRAEKLLEFGWKVIEFKDWEAEPDGTIFLIDECHNDLPLRPSASPVPKHVSQLAEHRVRGFDFFLLTQHPMNIDAFVRKIIGAPGWHQHLKRVFGGTKTTRVLQWDAVRSDCEKDGSGKSAQITTRMQPKEVYDWYESASTHTEKVRIPKQVIFLGVAAVVVPLLVYAAVVSVKSKMGPSAVTVPVGSTSVAVPASVSAKSAVRSPVEYADAYTARFAGLQYTAPAYDELTRPSRVPVPAACIVGNGKPCKCYTQDGTPLVVAVDQCMQIVKGGLFLDFVAEPSKAPGREAAPHSLPDKQIAALQYK